jgi:hypothetical protein
MKTLRSLALILIGSLPMSAQEPSPRSTTSSVSFLTNASNHSKSFSATQNSISIGLNGIVIVPPARTALLEIEFPGREVLRCVLKEGEKVAGVELLRIDERGRKVTVHYGAFTNDVMLLPTSNGDAIDSDTEKQQDVSHREYHSLRARLDRERDMIESEKQATDPPRNQ